MNQPEHITNSSFRQNPLLLFLLGACPSLSVASSAYNALIIGLTTTFVLCMSNIFISAVKDFVPDKVRIPALIIINVCFVTIADLWMQAWSPSLAYHLGLFISLIVINCLILGKAGNFAFHNSIFSSFVNGLVIGLGFMLTMVVIGSICEMLGTGTVFGQKFIAEKADGILVFLLAPGAFITIGFLAAIVRKVSKKS